jgi:hypothetical protein
LINKYSENAIIRKFSTALINNPRLTEPSVNVLNASPGTPKIAPNSGVITSITDFRDKKEARKVQLALEDALKVIGCAFRHRVIPP